MSRIIKIANTKNNTKLKLTDEDRKTPELEESKEDALKKKFEQEFQKGYEEAAKKLEGQFEAEYSEKLSEAAVKVNMLFTEVQKRMEEYEKSFGDIVLNLSTAISEKIVEREVKISSPLLENIREASQKIIGANYLLVKLNPSDKELLTNQENDLFTAGNFSKIKFETDERIEQGGFVIETDIGNIDGRISSQINELKKVIQNN